MCKNKNNNNKRILIWWIRCWGDSSHMSLLNMFRGQRSQRFLPKVNHQRLISSDAWERSSCSHTDKSLKTHMTILAHIYTNTKTFSAHKQNTHAIHCQRLTPPPPIITPYLCHISATVCRGGSRVITSVRQEIPLCGWRLTNAHREQHQECGAAL